MNQLDTLRGIVAKLSGTDVAAIGPDFSLEIPALKGSLKRAALTASIRRELGINSRAAHLARTFSDLQSAVLEPAVNRQAPPGDPVATPAPAAPVKVQASNPTEMKPHISGFSAPLRCGVDIEVVEALPKASDYREHEFYQSHFTPGEIAYCVLQDNPRMHFAARWCAKEALFKAEPALRETPLSSIEVVRATDGNVSFRHLVTEGASPLPHALSLSHTESHAIALVVGPPPRVVVPALDSETATAAAPSGSIMPFISAVAWLIAMSFALAALLRTMR